jgi:hypothetical protein
MVIRRHSCSTHATCRTPGNIKSPAAGRLSCSRRTLLQSPSALQALCGVRVPQIYSVHAHGSFGVTETADSGRGRMPSKRALHNTRDPKNDYSRDGNLEQGFQKRQRPRFKDAARTGHGGPHNGRTDETTQCRRAQR